MSINWFKRLTESQEEKKQRQLCELAQTEDFRQMIKEEAKNLVKETKEQEKKQKQEERKKHYEKVEKAKEDINTIGDEMKDSNEPFVNVLSIGFTKENGIEVKLDYNEAFIRYLHAAGVKANSDEETVRLWLAHLNYDISQEALAENYVMNGVDDDEKPDMDYDEMFNIDEEDSNESD